MIEISLATYGQCSSTVYMYRHKVDTETFLDILNLSKGGIAPVPGPWEPHMFDSPDLMLTHNRPDHPNGLWVSPRSGADILNRLGLPLGTASSTQD